MVENFASENEENCSADIEKIIFSKDGKQDSPCLSRNLASNDHNTIQYDESHHANESSTRKVSSEDENSNISEYVPSEYAESDNGSLFSDEDEPADATQSAVNSSCESSAYSLQASFNVPGNSACNDREQMSELSHGPKGGQKKNFCFYCKTVQSKIARHLINKHSDKEEVKKFIHLPKKNLERLQIITQIRKKGNFLYNVNEQWNNGKLIPVRRPNQNEKRTGQNFVSCSKCRGFYAKNNIRHHYCQCAKKKDNARNVLVEARKITGRIHEKASLVLRQDVFPTLRDDDIVRIIRYDKLIILYGNKLCKKLPLHHQHDEIRTHLRRLGRLLQAIRKIDPNITDMESVFDPKYYNVVVEAVNVLAELDPKTQLYKVPSVAAALGTTLKKLGQVLESECIRDHNAEKKVHEGFSKAASGRLYIQRQQRS